MTYSRMGTFCAAALLVMAIAAFALASPPVPAPPEGFGISTYTDVEVRGDFQHESSLTWTWMHDTQQNGNSTLAYPGTNQLLAAGGRAGQIRYMNDVHAIDGYVQFNNKFEAMSDEQPNLKVSKDFGYVALKDSLIAIADDKERIGLSLISNGDTAGLGDMPSLCPWASGELPATNEFIAAGSSTSTTTWMVSHTDSDVTGTVAPSLNHSISATGEGTASAAMIAKLMIGDAAVTRWGTAPNLIGRMEYSEKSLASGIIDKFNSSMHYNATIPQYQMPEPWYSIQ